MRKLIPPIAGTVLTVAFELSIVRGWFESVPDTIVALLWFIPVLLWIYWLYTHEEIKNKMHLLYAYRPMASLAIFVIVGGVLGASVGALGWWSLKEQRKDQQAAASGTSIIASASVKPPELVTAAPTTGATASSPVKPPPTKPTPISPRPTPPSEPRLPDGASTPSPVSFVPSVDVVYDPGSLAFNFFNHGQTNIYLWGDRLDDGPKSIDAPRTITPTGAYHIWAQDVA
jgi:hypothetical protein